ncbi:hypothetical protein SKAU_G00261490 [Synaphobranchus kaupii]|uniref:Nucleoporin Nup153 N-terminal domain-containing protein n=1 Tax=Synaphobranchus kaupii TaxID=118154 RepID=A0A9Q1EYG8_SYNKA|nr:hypothetical protein SKAU_G00261490 [Synaphobranchus kaupii]
MRIYTRFGDRVVARGRGMGQSEFNQMSQPPLPADGDDLSPLPVRQSMAKRLVLNGRNLGESIFYPSKTRYGGASAVRSSLGCQTRNSFQHYGVLSLAARCIRLSLDNKFSPLNRDSRSANVQKLVPPICTLQALPQTLPEAL